MKQIRNCIIFCIFFSQKINRIIFNQEFRSKVSAVSTIYHHYSLQKIYIFIQRKSKKRGNSVGKDSIPLDTNFQYQMRSIYTKQFNQLNSLNFFVKNVWPLDFPTKNQK
ncbi:hypothetical protein TTHERM_000088069 (macronuclear) [Tetrahymena thermophila SB210]|uniref:Uncharacterized protein n=1 Tax=Tetrahymena thermophila (strain SB210) TaxID=312017 RepID=W7XCL8_TETTS|nr:hypothetical protein TTHERM_000088069 [Tetrahymena thermophila SB210]EWS75212.1 hypothetical protein TTHERM_000088069 [Tetrahymena thermophila SB210]|eukprot:XP_012652203.1 hypothetical protein TTHERM_000088069 [Tetrahymena thermophila SB210]